MKVQVSHNILYVNVNTLPHPLMADSNPDFSAQIRCTQTLALWDTDRYFLQVAVADTDGTFNSGPHNITIEIINLNAAPYFLNLPGTITVPEDSVAATPIFTVQYNY